MILNCKSLPGAYHPVVVKPAAADDHLVSLFCIIIQWKCQLTKVHPTRNGWVVLGGVKHGQGNDGTSCEIKYMS